MKLLRLTATIATVLFAGAAFAQAIVDARLQSALSTATGPVEVIVTFKGSGPPTPQEIALLKQIGITQGVTLQALPMACVLATASQVDALAKQPDVRSLYLNRQLTYYNYDATSITGVRRLRTDPSMTVRNGGFPYSGKGIGVLINDSGVDATHQDLQFGSHVVQNVQAAANLHAYSDVLLITYIEYQPNTDLGSGHGTHVAGIVGGTGAKSNGKYEGVAPGASLIGYGSGAVLFILDAVGGFDYALTHQFQYGIRVITNSWGTSGAFEPDDPVNVASKAAYDRGIVVTFAAGNDGPGENTMNPYSLAPWVISVAAGDKDGKLADFSSRGVKDQKGTFTFDGEAWVYENRPTITAPGVDIISTRTLTGALPLLAATDDASMIEPAYLPYYTVMSGTSMATPHVAGIVALMLEANPKLLPADVKAILQQTATNMPGYEAWEVGAGYVNAYAAVDRAYHTQGYGKTVNAFRTFNSNVKMNVTRTPFTIDYDPTKLTSTNRYYFNVPSGLTELVARVDVYGLLGVTGNTINLVLIAPDGTEYSSGVYLLFPIYTDRTVSVSGPMPGNWAVELRGLRGTADNPTSGVALPEQVNGVLTFKSAGTYTGLNDISGDPAEAAIKTAVAERLVDGYPNGTYKPSNSLVRRELANYLTMGTGIRQFLPIDGSRTFLDVGNDDIPFVEAVAAKGAAIRDRYQRYRGVMLATGSRMFSPSKDVKRVDIAYSLVQSLGLEKEALERNGTTVTVQYKDTRIPIDDASDIPSGFEGYVQIALDLNIMNAYFSLVQGPYDLQPTLHATFKPLKTMTRGEYAVEVVRFFSTFFEGYTLPPPSSKVESFGVQNFSVEAETPSGFALEQNYPNPFNPTTTISYSIPNDEVVSVEVYNSLGQKVRTLVEQFQTAGVHSVQFDASYLPSGTYFYRLTAGKFSQVKAMVVLK